ncbi:MAG: ABC transporter ATP-binding protein [Firmicutes bacterium]|nr:ABC transporter ATP-binding protein [Bacillota bacterium]NBI65072.1 ABC transporter ATP-binding protein [Clostridiales bacterium]
MKENKEGRKELDLKIWGKVMPFFRPYWKYFLTTISLNVLLVAVDVMVPLFQSYAIDHFIVPDTLEGIFSFAAIYISVIVTQMVCVFFSVRAAINIEMHVGKDLKRAQFVHLQKLSFSYYNTTPVGYIHARVMSDTLKIATVLAWGLVDMFWAFVYVVGVFVIMCLLNWKLAVIIMLVVPFIAVLTAFFQKRMLYWNREIRETNSEITGAFNEGIVGVETSKTLSMEQLNEMAFQRISGKMKDSSMTLAKLTAIYMPLVLFFSSAVTAFVLARGGYFVQEQLIALGTLSVFLSYAVGIFEPIQQLARLMSELISCQANIERVTGLLEQEPNIIDSPEVIRRYGDSVRPKKENWEPIKGAIEFRDVTFRYPDGKENVLEHFSLKIPAGTTVAIVGETGAGKSTIVNLVGRFFEPTKGQILIDGKDYRQRSQLWLHSQMGYVLQNPHLFSGSIRENIRYGRIDATDQEVEQAAISVSADKVIEKLEQGYDTDAGEGGNHLSTGEKQLISLARAILADPAIFVLDEATSSIDTATEQLIQEATERLLRGHTSFMIAHRLSTIRNADMILVMRDGKVIEQGNHKELIRKKGYYYRLYSRQFEEEQLVRAFHGKDT